MFDDVRYAAHMFGECRIGAANAYGRPALCVCMTPMDEDDGGGYVRVAAVDAVREDGPLVESVDGRTVGLFHHEGSVYAVDNRCPHMGFPLSDGRVDDCVLTCPWHHARFDVTGGDTFDPWADDVRTYPVEVRDGDVWVDPDPSTTESAADRWRRRLADGLRENIRLVVAKAVVGLDDAGVPPTAAVETGVEFGSEYRADGWGVGLTTLGAMANLSPALRPEDRRRARYWGLVTVAEDCAGEPPRFAPDPFESPGHDADRLDRWFRENVEVRDADGATRVLRTAIRDGCSESTLAEMLVGAATDHLYLDAGHRLDSVNKAFETLDHVGWDHADAVLPSLVPGLASADRAEEESSWRQPIDLAALLFDAREALPDLVQATDADWTEPEGFVGTLLADDPERVVAALTDAVAAGASATDLAAAVAAAAGRRVARFGTANEFRDWNTVHHTYSYANAVHGMAGRADGPEAYRGVLDAAASVYLDRFLNTPPRPLPDPGTTDRTPGAVLDDLGEQFEREARDGSDVTRAGRLVGEFLDAGGDPARLKRDLGAVLLREDAGFHPRQHLEAGFRQYAVADAPERERVHLVAAARFLAAHTPTRGEGEATFRIAERLNRGEAVHEDGTA
jgi:nitrite reductase/ring-hydroxylating ferredoxin subunit